MAPNAKRHMIYFEVGKTGYAVDAAELSGVANSCPYVTYPGLPEKVVGLVQWSGKVYPAIDVFGTETADLRTSSVLFSIEGMKGPFTEVAVAVPGTVRVFFAETAVPPPADAPPFVSAMLIDSDGNEAYQLSLARIAEQVPKPLQTVRPKGGKKLAA